jgi:indoleamine 2,3-dioxygenase
VLWNWRPLFPEDPIDTLENLSTLHTYTGSLDEQWFYLISVAIEARGAPAIPMMLDAIEAARQNDTLVVTECLRSMAERLDEIGSLIQRMYENCDPHVFYHRIRPFLAGSKNMGEAGLPNGVLWDTGVGQQQYVQYAGSSNAQSSIIQFFDIVLGIEHLPTGERASDHSSSSDSEASTPPPNDFLKEMRNYMPGPHRRFLEHVERIANIRAFVLENSHDRALTTAYDACLAMLRALRDKHIQIVTRYIILKSRESRSGSRSLSPQSAKVKRSKIEKGRGTGGTALLPFLKQARDETGEPAIDTWARRLLNNGPGAAEMNAAYRDSGPVRPVQSKMSLAVGAPLTKIGEHSSGEMHVVGLAGTWSVDDSEGGICHW